MTHNHGNHGENNGLAKLSDDDVDMIRELYEVDRFKPRAERFWTASRLAEKFEISLRYVFYVVSYTRRVPTIEDEQ